MWLHNSSPINDDSIFTSWIGDELAFPFGQWDSSKQYKHRFGKMLYTKICSVVFFEAGLVTNAMWRFSFQLYGGWANTSIKGQLFQWGHDKQASLNGPPNWPQIDEQIPPKANGSQAHVYIIYPVPGSVPRSLWVFSFLILRTPLWAISYYLNFTVAKIKEHEDRFIRHRPYRE